MVEKMLVEYMKLHKQRALLMSGLINLMVNDFQGDDINKFKVVLSKQFIDVMGKEEDDMLLADEVEQMVFRSIKTFIEKENALSKVKNIIKGELL